MLGVYIQSITAFICKYQVGLLLKTDFHDSSRGFIFTTDLFMCSLGSITQAENKTSLPIKSLSK